MKIFIINLKKDIERRVFMEKQLKTFGIDFEFFDGINTRELTDDEINIIYDENKSLKVLGRKLKIGEIGCAKSHMLLYSKIIENNLDSALIIEDDSIINPNFIKVYNNIKNNKNDWDFISLNYTIFDINGIKIYIKNLLNDFKNHKSFYYLLKNFLLMLGASLVDNALEIFGKIFGPGIIKRFKPLYLTGGYFITKEGANKLLDIHNKIFLPADIIFEKYRKIIDFKMYFIYPLLIKQNDNFITNIQK